MTGSPVPRSKPDRCKHGRECDPGGRTRDAAIDAAKAGGIVLVVLGHIAGMPSSLVDTVFQFHSR